MIGFRPTHYIANESAGAVNFTIGILSGTLSLDVVVEFYTESITAEGNTMSASNYPDINYVPYNSSW